MLGQMFGEYPHRQELLKQVWTGFSCLIERAKSGFEGIDFTSVMLTQQRDSRAAYQRLEAEFRRTSTFLQAELTAVRTMLEDTERARKEQSARADAAEAATAEALAQYAKTAEELLKIQSALDTAQRQQAALAAQLQAELAKVGALSVEAGGCARARAEAAQAQRLVSEQAAALREATAMIKRLEEQVEQLAQASAVAAATVASVSALTRGELAAADADLERCLHALAAAAAAAADVDAARQAERKQAAAREEAGRRREHERDDQITCVSRMRMSSTSALRQQPARPARQPPDRSLCIREACPSCRFTHTSPATVTCVPVPTERVAGS